MRCLRTLQNSCLLLLLITSIAACGGSGSGSTDDIPVDNSFDPDSDGGGAITPPGSNSGSGPDSEPDTPADTNPDETYVPPVGSPLADGSAPFIVDDATYFLDEDETLRARLAFRSSDTANTAPLNSASQNSPVVEYQLISQPTNGRIELDSATGSFNYEPEADFFGTDTFQFYVTSDETGSRQAVVSLVVAGSNDAPTLTAEIVSVVEQGTAYSVLLDGQDVDGDELRYSSVNFPQWLNLNPASGLLSGEPQQADVGIYRSLLVRVTDPSGESVAFGPFGIEVIDINDSPTVNPAQFPAALDARERVLVNLFPDDPDGEFVRLSAELNDFIDVEILGGSLAVIARDVSEVTTINLVVIAQDLRGKSTREIIPIVIHPLSADGRGRTLMGRRRGAGFHLVVLGDGYKTDQQNTFGDDVENLIATMERDPAIAAHLSGWNIHALSVDSEDSGIDDNVANDVRHTAFDSGYFCRGIERLICANDAQVFNVALDSYPYLDQIVLLVNDARYGGSGGSIAVASSGAPEIALHEMGHSIAHLADEYVDSLIPSTSNTGFVEGRFANISAIDDPQLVPWSRWIDDMQSVPTTDGEFGVGVFKGGFYQLEGFFRPTSNSRMRDNEQNFGLVNGEQWALSVYQRTNPITDFSPLVRNLEPIADIAQIFSVTPLFSEGVQLIQWSLDGEELIDLQNEKEIELRFDSGNHVVGLVVSDITGRIRVKPPHAGIFSWQWSVEVP